MLPLHSAAPETVRIVDLTGKPPGQLRVQRNTGSVKAGELRPGTGIHHPRDDWAPLSDFDFSSRITRETAFSTRNVTVVDFGQAFYEQARHSFLEHLQGDHADARGAVEVVASVRDQLREQLAARAGIDLARVLYSTVHVNPPRLPGTAYDFDTGSYVGLHFDKDWLRDAPGRDDPVGEFALLSVNLGSRERYFVFSELDIGAMRRVPGIDSGVGQSANEEIKERFLAQEPSRPLLRLTLEPGRAYLCDPLRLLHDGATNSAGVPDVALLVFGLFRSIPLRSACV